MIIADANGVIMRVNSAFTETTGYTPAEAVGQTPRMLKSGRHDADFYRAMWESINLTGKWQGEIWDRRKNGEIYPKWLTITSVKGDEGVTTHYVGLQLDITDRKQAEKQLQILAHNDPLTGLPNRALFHDRLEHGLELARRHQHSIAVLFLDLDHFKEINDTLGHDVGDILLKEATNRLLACVRKTDTVARMGGDEFTVIITEMRTTEDAECVAKDILKAFSQPFELNERFYNVGCSIGIAIFPEHGQDNKTLLKHADSAMYYAKRQRNTFCIFNNNR
uniref:Cyclic di-GMP phosphodiesterase Gmr n=1 Tax=mine drainage metagenome TaxID=410659 RepID=E6QSY6_9ZZZZ